MPAIVNRSQQVRSAGISPKAENSRVIILQLLVAGGVGNDDYAVTNKLGNRLWLLSVDLWIQATTQADFLSGFLKVTAGTGQNLNAGIVSLEWTSVMDVSMIMPQGMMFFCCDLHLRFDMRKLYVGESQRFGLYSGNLTIKQYSILAALQISEG